MCCGRCSVVLLDLPVDADTLHAILRLALLDLPVDADTLHAAILRLALLDLPVDADTLHAILWLVLRLTRDHKFAEMFASMGEVRDFFLSSSSRSASRDSSLSFHSSSDTFWRMTALSTMAWKR